jgi:pyrimidine operon attenuation protein/uracil phosphoribosyltransferase
MSEKRRVGGDVMFRRTIRGQDAQYFGPAQASTGGLIDSGHRNCPSGDFVGKNCHRAPKSMCQLP